MSIHTLFGIQLKESSNIHTLVLYVPRKSIEKANKNLLHLSKEPILNARDCQKGKITVLPSVYSLDDLRITLTFPEHQDSEHNTLI